MIKNHITKLISMYADMSATTAAPSSDQDISPSTVALVAPPPAVSPAAPIPVAPAAPTPVVSPPLVPTPLLATPTHPEVLFATHLNFKATPQIHRSGDGTITVHKRTQPGELERVMIMMTLNRWGYINLKLTYKAREMIAKAACSLTAFDYGYAKPFGITMLSQWQASINRSIEYGPPTP